MKKISDYSENDFRLFEEIANYIKNDKINYAIMIDGEWGSGKTFFVKKYILKNYINSIYVSLYGVSSIEKLSKSIYFELLKSKYIRNPFFRLLQKIYNNKIVKMILFLPVKCTELIIYILKSLISLIIKSLSIISCSIGVVNLDINPSNLDKIDYYGAIKLFKDINKYILVVDDLERCSIPVEETLGFINDLVEHRNMKVIIVANEEEIDKTLSKNIELKTVSVLNDKIDFSEIEDKKKKEKNHKKDIKKRIEYLYDENNKYKRIKEKLIGKVFEYTPELGEVYFSLSYKYRDNEDFDEILTLTKDSVLEVMHNKRTNNLRTLDFYFDAFEYIYKCSKNIIDKCNIDKEYIYNSITKSLINSCITLKRGNDLPLLSFDRRFDYVSYEKEDDLLYSFNQYLTFDFINEYLLYNRIEKSSIEITIKEFEQTNCDKLPPDDPFNKLNNQIWFNTSSDIDIILETLNNNIRAQKYNTELYSAIIRQISNIEAMGYDSPIIEEIIQSIKENIRDGQENQFDNQTYFANEKSFSFYSKHIKELSNVNTKTKIINNNNYLNTLLKEDDWGIKLYNYINDNREEYYKNKRFFSEFNCEELLYKLFDSNIKDVYYFKYSIDVVYDLDRVNKYNDKDIDSLIQFTEKLKKMLKIRIGMDPMKYYPFKILIEKMNEIIEETSEFRKISNNNNPKDK